MTEINDIPTEPDITPREAAYRAAFDQVVADHVMDPPNADRLVRCSCGDQGDVQDMSGHYGAEAGRAGSDAAEAYDAANP